jgi:hypothetical protein
MALLSGLNFIWCSESSHLFAPLKIFVIPAKRSASRDP